MKVSQSIIKDLFAYINGDYCGLLFEHRYLAGHFNGSGTKATRMGDYFEFLVTGQAPISGITEPLRTTTGKISKEFDTVREQAIFAKTMFHERGIKILESAEKLKTDTSTGVLDIIAEWPEPFIENPDPLNDKNICIVDLKLSGLIDDKWSDMGWDVDSLHTKERLIIQAKHYKYLYREIHGFTPPFFFIVFSATDVGYCKIIEVKVTKESMEAHAELVITAKDYFEQEMKKGFEARPKYSSCRKCPMNDLCEDAKVSPEIDGITV